MRNRSMCVINQALQHVCTWRLPVQRAGHAFCSESTLLLICTPPSNRRAPASCPRLRPSMMYRYPLEVLPRVPVAARRPGLLLRIVGRAYMSRAEVPLMRKKRRSRQSARASAVAIDAATSDVGQEVVERRAFCLEDYVTAARNPSKTLSASLFMFFATLFST